MSRARAIRWGLAGVCVVYAWLRFVNWQPRRLGAGIDASWGLAVQEAFRHGLELGRDIIFTSGPYGFAYARVLHPATYELALLLQAALASVVVASLWRLLGTLVPRPVARAALVLLAVEAMVTSYEGLLYTAVFLPLLMSAWPVRDGAAGDGPAFPRGVPDRVLLHLQVVAASLVGLMKFSFLVALGLVMAAVAVGSVARRRLPGAAITCALALLGLWLAAGQPLGAIPGYLEASARLSGGYAAAMSLPGPPAETLLFAGSALLIAAGFALALPAGPRRAAALPAATLAAGLFLCFKAVYTRHDMHAWAGISILTPLAILCAGLLARRGGAGRRGLAVASVAGVVALAWQTFSRDDHEAYPGSINRFDPARIAVQAARMGAVLGGRFDAEGEWRESTRGLRSRFPLKRRPGSYDVYPVSQSVVIAHGLPRHPRPVLQSYAAYTPWLLERNARHLRGEDAPRNLLFAVRPMDGRYPSLDDSLSWIELLTRYRVAGATPHFADFRRARRVRAHALEPIGAAPVRFGSSVPVPGADSGPVWVEIDVEPSALGRVLGLVYKLPELYLEVEGRGFDTRRRLVPGIARAGFLLSPLVETQDELVALARDRPGALTAKAVSRLRLGGEGPDAPLGYRDVHEIRFFRLRLGPRGGDAPAGEG